jgi:hypothetical protein
MQSKRSIIRTWLQQHPRVHTSSPQRMRCLSNQFKMNEEHLKKLFSLICYATQGQVDKLESMYQQYPDINVSDPDYDGRTALHLAAEEGHFDVVKWLVEHGANVNATDKFANTVLRGAVRNNQNHIGQYLREHGAKLKIDEIQRLHDKSEDNVEFIERLEIIWNNFEAMDPDNVSKHRIVRFEALNKALLSKGLDITKHNVLNTELEPYVQTGINWESFKAIMIGKESVLQRAMNNELAIRNWKQFAEKVQQLFDEVKKNNSGDVASYIPELACADPSTFAVTLITVDGQVLSLGDVNTEFTLQSCFKPIVYSLAIEDYGYDYIHQYIGKEPSGVSFNAFTLSKSLITIVTDYSQITLSRL